MKRILVLVALMAISVSVNAKSSGKENLIAIGQGVSYPTLTSNVWLSNGLTHENSVGAMYQNGMKITAEYVDLDPSGSIVAGEIGFGKGDIGAAIGAAKNDCSGCETQVGATVGFGFSSVGLGVGYHDEAVSVGFILNPSDTHRFGVTADSSSKDTNKYSAFGAGYSFVGSEFTFTVDASKRNTDGASESANKIIYLTPGVMFKGNSFQVSVNYDMDLNDDNDTHDSEFWLGVGFAPTNNLNLAIYSKYVGEWSVAASFFF